MYLIQKRYKLIPFLVLFVSILLSSSTYAQVNEMAVDTIAHNDSTISPSAKDTTATDSIKEKSSKKTKIETPITYSANDSIVLDMSGNAYMYGEGKVEYDKQELTAAYIHLNTDSSNVNAEGAADDTGEIIGLPILIDNGEEYHATSLNYNINTKKGYIKHGIVQQDEAYIIGERTKKIDEEYLCMKNGKYTTCDHHEHPHFYLNLTKAKVKKDKWVVTGPAYLVLLDVPLPLAIPFGYFPFTKSYSSGVIIPSYGDDLARGFYLSNGGYYFAINDYMDLTLTGDIYTMGTWAVNAQSKYIKRYKYNGNFNFSYREDITGDKDLPNYQKAKNMAIVWTHAQNAKASPNQTFSASVNFSSSGYDRSNINNYYNSAAVSQNVKSSSISYGYNFPESPFSFSMSLLASQRTSDSTISLTTPDLTVTMSRIYPFKREDKIGKDRWYEKIYMSYSGSIKNYISTKEDSLLNASLQKDWQNGIKHTIPVGASFNLLKYLSITPSVTYNERWYTSYLNKEWDSENFKEVTDTVYQFNRNYDFTTALSASTKLYGFYTPSRAIFGDKIDRVRHVLTPTISYSFKPDFSDPMWGMWGSYSRPVSTTDPTEYEKYYSNNSNGIYGYSSTGKSSSINIAISNNIELKWKQENDTTGEPVYKTVSIIDALSGNASYNYAADSLNWSTIGSNIRLKLYKGFNLNLSASFEPYLYALDTLTNGGTRINSLRWDHGKLPRLISTSTSFSYTINNDTFKKKEEKKGNGEQNKNEDKKSNSNTTEDGYVKPNVRWSMSFDYSMRFGNTSDFDTKILEYERELTHNLGFRSTLSLTSSWNFSFGTSYDFDNKEFTYSTLGITRDLHCWNMTANIVPIGPYKTYNFTIGVKSALLSDLKYDQQKDQTTAINWY